MPAHKSNTETDWDLLLPQMLSLDWLTNKRNYYQPLFTIKTKTILYFLKFPWKLFEKHSVLYFGYNSLHHTQPKSTLYLLTVKYNLDIALTERCLTQNIKIDIT